MSKKVLVIDDEVSIGEVIKDFLGSIGFDTIYAAEAQSGLDFVAKEKPDLVLLDILMPEISGIECLKKIKEMAPETIVLIMSGLQDEQIAKKAIREGAYDYIKKPFDLDYLQNSLLARIFPN